jgi:Holliday junction resolvase
MSRRVFLERGSHKNHSTVSHTRAPQQERDLARRFEGKRVPGSGSGPQKGDVKKAFGIFRIEAKTTTKKSFTVTKEMIEKIEVAALTTNEMPVIIIEFLDEQGNPEKEIAVLPTYALEVIANAQ